MWKIVYGYYYDTSSRQCKFGENGFLNCKKGNVYCDSCKNDYYINITDHLCYLNKNEGIFYKCASTDVNSTACASCSEGYYLGNEDLLCSKVEGCELSENEDRCLECRESYCLDV